MTRKDSVRAATDTARDSVRHAADVVSPYAEQAAKAAVSCAQEARTRLAPVVAEAAHQARTQYDSHVQPRLDTARSSLPPKVDAAATRAAATTRRAARQAGAYAAPYVEQAVNTARTTAEPVREEAVTRGGAALAALRGQVTAAEIEKLVRKKNRRSRTGRLAKRLAVLGLLAGGAVAAWKWWDRQANPDWLVEPPAPTDIPDRAPLTGDADAGSTRLDPDVEAKRDEEKKGSGGSR
ncbi:DUF5324 family protein [Streptomyces sp. NPDC059740]|uniref:DUF5324 family protein n=1 Tax=Streptomyces sp. NPDC059740 TaxID=3346926 RepID=UPI00366196BE